MSSPAIDVFELNGRLTVRSFDGRFLRVQTPAGAPAPLLGVYHSQIRQQLEARAVQKMHPHPGRERLALLGPDAGWEPVISALTGLDVHPADIPGISVEPYKLVLQMAHTRTDRVALDDFPAAGTAVLRCYREGEILFVDPLALNSCDPTGSQVLRRRLAASAAAHELDGWLNTDRPGDATLADLPPLATEFLGARIRSMISAWQYDTSELPALRRTLWRLDARTLCSSEHPVLGFAEPAKSPVRPR